MYAKWALLPDLAARYAADLACEAAGEEAVRIPMQVY